jgi:hypothetical protein
MNKINKIYLLLRSYFFEIIKKVFIINIYVFYFKI